MPLSSSTSRRALTHTRATQIEAFARDDGLWDIDAHISNIKTYDTALASQVRLALRTDGEVVAQYYPRWAVRSPVESNS